MAAARRVVAISIGAQDLAALEAIARSRTEPASRVERARILLRYYDDPSSYAVGLTCRMAMPSTSSVILAPSISFPASRPDFTASRTAFSITRWEVTPTSFRNLRTERLNWSSFIATAPLPPSRHVETLRMSCDFVPLVSTLEDTSHSDRGDYKTNAGSPASRLLLAAARRRQRLVRPSPRSRRQEPRESRARKHGQPEH